MVTADGRLVEKDAVAATAQEPKPKLKRKTLKREDVAARGAGGASEAESVSMAKMLDGDICFTPGCAGKRVGCGPAWERDTTCAACQAASRIAMFGHANLAHAFTQCTFCPEHRDLACEHGDRPCTIGDFGRCIDTSTRCAVCQADA